MTTTPKNFKKVGLLTEDQKEILERLMDAAKRVRAEYKYSEDEKMMPTAILYRPDGVDILMLTWRDNREKYKMAAMVNAKARAEKAHALAFATDSRWVDGSKFAEYYRFDPVKIMGAEKFQAEYHRILAAHGGEVKNLPRELWNEAIVVFANGPDFPMTVKMAHYKEGPNDTIEWLEDQLAPADAYKSDLLTDWWD